MLSDGGRLVVLTAASHDPTDSKIKALYADLPDRAAFVFTASVDGRIYARHGTTTDTRLTVVDRVPQHTNTPLISAGHAHTPAELLALLERLPPRAPLPSLPAVINVTAPRPTVAGQPQKHTAPQSTTHAPQEGEELRYEKREGSAPKTTFTDRIYEPYEVQTIVITHAQPHPTKLVQSAAMASVQPPLPSYRPLMPKRLVEDGMLSNAQLETVIYAGEAHRDMLAGHYNVDDSFDTLTLATERDADAVQFRKGFFLGDGTGSGKGRQAAGIILDNWLQGRRKALWISKSDKLIEDAQRDWSALGQEKLLIAPQSRYRQGTPISISEGILFTTYATLALIRTRWQELAPQPSTRLARQRFRRRHSL